MDETILYKPSKFSSTVNEPLVPEEGRKSLTIETNEEVIVGVPHGVQY
jgi:hypothetical protein